MNTCSDTNAGGAEMFFLFLNEITRAGGKGEILSFD